MLVRLTCSHPGCGASFSVEEARAGAAVRCVQCGKATASPARATRPAARATADGEGRITPERPAPKTALTRLGRFQVRQRLGAGAFGTVYRAHDPQLDREVALKVPNAGAIDSPKRIERFLREARSAAQLRHPFIVPVFEAGQADGHYYIASAFVEGTTLAAAIPEGGMEPRRAAGIVQRLADATAYAHDQRVVHRDIKPSNVILDKDDHPHLMDFGLAAREDEVEKLTHDGAVLGTPAYMPPEQAAGHTGEVKPAVDQYALGVVLYELLTGQVPFEGPPAVVLHAVMTQEPIPVRAVRPDVPRDLETICKKAMAKRPQDRYTTCGLLAIDLRRWLEGEPIRARKQGVGERLARWVRREPLVTGLAGGLVALSVAALLVIAALYGDAKAQARRAIEEAERKAEAEGRIQEEKRQGEAHRLRSGDAEGRAERAAIRINMYKERAEAAEAKVKEQDAKRPLSPRVVRACYGLGSEQGAVRPDGGRIATSAGPGFRDCLGVWNFEADVLCFVLARTREKGHGLPVYRPDGRRIAACSIDKNPEVKVWDADTGVLIFAKPIGSKAKAIAYSPDGKRLLTMGDKLTIWDAEDGRVIFQRSDNAPSASGVVFSRDGKRFATAHDGEPVPLMVWDTAETRVISAMLGHDSVSTSMLFRDGKEVAARQSAPCVTGMAFSPDGERIVSCGLDKVAKIWNATTARELLSLEGHTLNVTCVAFSPDNQQVATGSADGTVRIWDSHTGRERVRFTGHDGKIDQLTYTPDGRRILSQGGRAAILWEARSEDAKVPRVP